MSQMITASGREEGRAKVKSQESKGSNWSLQWMDVIRGCQASKRDWGSITPHWPGSCCGSLSAGHSLKGFRRPSKEPLIAKAMLSPLPVSSQKQHLSLYQWGTC